jgi:hypothetical protein
LGRTAMRPLSRPSPRSQATRRDQNRRRECGLAHDARFAMVQIMNTATKSNDASSLSRSVDALSEDWRQGKRPVVLAVDGRHRFQIDDEASFQLLLGLLERLENTAAIQTGLDDFAAGRSLSLDEFKQKVGNAHGIPG